VGQLFLFQPARTASWSQPHGRTWPGAECGPWCAAASSRVLQRELPAPALMAAVAGEIEPDMEESTFRVVDELLIPTTPSPWTLVY